MNEISAPFSVRASGPLACFTRPEFKAERVTYPVMTPSAARGILDAILWKPAMRWRVQRIKVLAPIVFASFRRNEVSTAAPAPTRSVINSGGEYRTLLVEDRRQQRNTVALRDVDYIIEARIELTPHAGHGDNLVKFVEMFRRRLEKGQHFHQPYLGCREFAAVIAPAPSSDDKHTQPIDDTRDLGLMLWDIDFRTDQKGNPQNRPIFFAAKLEKGVIEVPRDAESADASVNEAHGLSTKRGET